jgi:hypothetical protein
MTDENVRLRFRNPFGFKQYEVGDEFRIKSLNGTGNYDDVRYGRVEERKKYDERKVGGVDIYGGYEYETSVSSEHFDELNSAGTFGRFIGGDVEIANLLELLDKRAIRV